MKTHLQMSALLVRVSGSEREGWLREPRKSGGQKEAILINLKLGGHPNKAIRVQRTQSEHTTEIFYFTVLSMVPT